MTEMNDNLKYITEAISKTNLDDTDAIVETMTDPVYLEKLNNLIDEQVMSAESNNTALPPSEIGERSRHGTASSYQGSILSASQSNFERAALPVAPKTVPKKANAPVLMMVDDNDKVIKDKRVKDKSPAPSMVPLPLPTASGSKTTTIHNKSNSPYVVSDTITKVEPVKAKATAKASSSGQNKTIGKGQNDFIDNDDVRISGSPVNIRKNAIEDVTFTENSINVSLRAFKNVPTHCISASIENGIAKIKAQSDELRLGRYEPIKSHGIT